jgi:MOSC domain-containing protein YiiM
MNGRVFAISVSNSKGTRKRNVADAVLVAKHGIDGDAHAGEWPRQVSLLASESINRVRAQGLDVRPGDFAENITTSGMDFRLLSPGDRVSIGQDAIIEVTQIGKNCSEPCEIGRRLGRCIMPEEGVFARVVRGGRIEVGDAIMPVSRFAADTA